MSKKSVITVLKQQSQAQHIREASYTDGMRYRDLALANNSKEDAMLAILNFRIWIRASIINLIETKQIAGVVNEPLQLKSKQ